MRLDIGCANRPKADVNIDLFRFSTEATEDQSPTKTKADVIAEATYLPFRDECFDEVICHDVIEHTLVPQRLLSEIVRVLKPHGLADLRCPHRFGHGAKKEYHRQYFKPSWFTEELAKLPCSNRIYVKPRSFLPFLPDEIQVTIWKWLVEPTFGEKWLLMEERERFHSNRLPGASKFRVCTKA